MLRDAPLFNALSIASLRTMTSFDCQELSNTAWAYAVFGYMDIPLLNSIAAASIRLLMEFDGQGMANTAWAFATCGF